MKNRISGLATAFFAVLLSAVVIPEAVNYAVQHAPQVVAQYLNPEGVGVVTLVVTSFAHIKRLERQKANLGGFVKMLILSEEDFDTTAGDWPKAADIVAGKSIVVPVPKTGKTFARIVYDLNSAKGGSKRSGELGYQSYTHELECALAGYTEEQQTAIGLTLNTGGVVVAYRQNGDRVVFGSALCPLMISDETNFGGKAEDANMTSLKFVSARGLEFRPVLLGSAVTLTETV